MKKLCLFLCCSVAFAAFSQDIVIKPTVGVNFSNVANSSDGKYTSQVGYQIGGSVAIGKKLYLEPGVFYAQKSSKYQTGLPNNYGDVKFDISGVRIPVAIGYSLLGNQPGAVNLRVFGGGSAFIITSVHNDEKSFYNSTNWGVFAGAGVDFLMLFVDVKYEWSLTNLHKDTQPDIGKFRSVFINAGVRLPI